MVKKPKQQTNTKLVPYKTPPQIAFSGLRVMNYTFTHLANTRLLSCLNTVPYFWICLACYHFTHSCMKTFETSFVT